MYSSNSGVCPGSTQPGGLVMRATLAPAVPVFTRPTNSSIRFGLFPADWMTVGFSIVLGHARSIPPLTLDRAPPQPMRKTGSSSTGTGRS